MRQPLPKCRGEDRTAGTDGTGGTELCQDIRSQTLNLRVLQQHLGLHLADSGQQQEIGAQEKKDGTQGVKMESRLIHALKKSFLWQRLLVPCLKSLKKFFFLFCKLSQIIPYFTHPGLAPTAMTEPPPGAKSLLPANAVTDPSLPV